MAAENLHILGIIPAREGSRRAPKKNYRPFAGSSLAELAILQALQSRRLTHVALSSDSEEILALGRAFPGLHCLQRPSALSGDTAPAMAYVRHALKILEGEDHGGQTFDLVVIIQPTSPLRTPEDIDATIELLLRHPEADSAVSVTRVDQMLHPLKLKTMKDQLLSPYFEEESGRFAAQSLPAIYSRNGAVYAAWRRGLNTRSDIIGQKSLGYIMPRERSIDVNDELDFELAEYLYRKQNKL